ncbi:MAG TPA: YidC/Oxa1 family insertase periplasmic-domain containing protein [Pirellulales bacterium]|nr:YidC/Oxa1 family insertase periplasmic-domain containing protein [Pirellulales bacterium]
MEDRQRFRLFLFLSALVLGINILVMRWAVPPAPQAGAPNQPGGAAGAAAKGAEEKGAKAKDDDAEKAAKPRAERKKKPAEAPLIREPAKEVAEEWGTLGSLDELDGYRMLVTWSNHGAAIECIELNSPRFHDLDDRNGYLGHLAAVDAAQGDHAQADEAAPSGARVRVVGRGTPAAVAGLQPGDVITALGEERISTAEELTEALEKTRPGTTVGVSIVRAGNPVQLSATLRRRPLELIKPEATDPLSFLLTLQEIDDETIAKNDDELPGLKMRTRNWTRRPSDPAHPDEVAFELLLSERQLEVAKIYQLAAVPANERSDLASPDYPAYHLDLRIEIRNLSDEARKVAYRLDGPTGLPTEGWWYAQSAKISRDWTGSPGLRDVVIGKLDNGKFSELLVSASKLADDKPGQELADKDRQFVFVGVDAQYFSTILIPQNDDETMPAGFASVRPLAVGEVPEKAKTKLLDVSCRIDSLPFDLEAGGEPAVHNFRIFAGPKRPALLKQYAVTNASPEGLRPIVYYGWFSWVSVPMLTILHFFYGIVGNFGLAIVMLTVLVRSCMFPLSRKQALGAAKMQELQPELKKLTEKYKNNPTERAKAQQELFRKHNYHPLSGCFPALIQLPIFLGLYRSLAVDIELRQAPLLSESIRWCSNLAAPDMLWRWDSVLFSFLSGETGWLGPYLNVLPLVTIGLFLWQQKMFLPPPADEQAAMQQKIMQYMMIFMGVMFFKVPSGLCLYFIASSLWGICERKLLPKTIGKSAAPPASGGRPSSPSASPNGNGNGARRGGKKKAKERDRG